MKLFFSMLFCILIIALPALEGQNILLASQNKITYPTEKRIPFSQPIEYVNYQHWKKGLSKKKKNVFLKSTIAGLLAGALIGLVLSLPSKAGCEILTPLLTPIIGEQEPCPPVSPKGAIIGGGLGVLIGLGVGQKKVKKIKFAQIHL